MFLRFPHFPETRDVKAEAPKTARAVHLLNQLSEAHADIDFEDAVRVSADDIGSLESAIARYEAESNAVKEIASSLQKQAEM